MVANHRHSATSQPGTGTGWACSVSGSASAIAAVDRLKEYSPRSIKFLCLLTCPEGIAAMEAAHPDVPIFTAAVDRGLDEHGYIVPGLGDAGDRIFGTK